MIYKNLSKKELVSILEILQRVLEGKGNSLEETKVNEQDDLESLIGTIPFLLTNKKIFEKNQDIADFAKKLNIDIPSPEKKKREDILGRIISAIANFDKRKVADLNIAIKELKKTDIKKGKFNFFRDWENAIKQMDI